MREHLKIRHTEIDDDIYMIIENKIPHLVRLSIQYFNSEYTYDYQIEGCYSLTYLAESFCLEEDHIRTLLEGICHVLEESEKYLLKEDRICLIPKYLYYDREIKEWKFIYLPGKGLLFEKSFHNLISYLLKWINYEHEELVKKLYKIHQECHRKEKDILQVLSIERNSSLSSSQDISQSELEVITFTEHQIENHEEGDTFSNNKFPFEKDKIIMGTIFVIFILGSFLAYKFLPVSPIKIGACLLLGVFSVISYFIFGRQKKERAEFDIEEDIKWESVHTQFLDMSLREENIWRLENRKTHDCIKLPEGSTTIGRRGKGANVTIADNSVSSFHCQLVVRESILYIQDLNSRNGTYVNGTKLSNDKMLLSKGDILQIGYQSFNVLYK